MFIEGHAVDDPGAQILPEETLRAEDGARVVVHDPEVEAVLIADEHFKRGEVGIVPEDRGQ